MLDPAAAATSPSPPPLGGRTHHLPGGCPPRTADLPPQGTSRDPRAGPNAPQRYPGLPGGGPPGREEGFRRRDGWGCFCFPSGLVPKQVSTRGLALEPRGSEHILQRSVEPIVPADPRASGCWRTHTAAQGTVRRAPGAFGGGPNGGRDRSVTRPLPCAGGPSGAALHPAPTLRGRPTRGGRSPGPYPARAAHLGRSLTRPLPCASGPSGAAAHPAPTLRGRPLGHIPTPYLTPFGIRGGARTRPLPGGRPWDPTPGRVPREVTGGPPPLLPALQTVGLPGARGPDGRLRAEVRPGLLPEGEPPTNGRPSGSQSNARPTRAQTAVPVRGQTPWRPSA